MIATSTHKISSAYPRDEVVDVDNNIGLPCLLRQREHLRYGGGKGSHGKSLVRFKCRDTGCQGCNKEAGVDALINGIAISVYCIFSTSYAIRNNFL